MATELLDGLNTGMSYAIYASVTEFGPDNGEQQLTPTKIKPKFEARAIYELLKGVDTKIYPVATDVKQIGNDKVYASLAALPEKVDVLITSLRADQAPRVIEEAAAAGIKRIWFQPGTSSPEALKLCEQKGIKATEGCALRHRTVSGLTRFVSPCFYMGMKSPKLPVR